MSAHAYPGLTPSARLRAAFASPDPVQVWRCEGCNLGMLYEEVAAHDTVCPGLSGPSQEVDDDSNA